jgi:hypothetical protein
MFEDYEDTDTETTPEYNGTVEESDFGREEKGSIPALALKALLAPEVKARPELVEQITHLTHEQSRLQKEIATQKAMLETWDVKLEHWKNIIESRLVLKPDDKANLEIAEEGRAAAKSAWTKAQRDFEEVQKNLKKARPKLRKAQAFSELDPEFVMSINLADGMAEYPDMMVRNASQTLTSTRIGLAGLYMYQITPVEQKMSQVRNELSVGESHPLATHYHELLSVYEAELDRAMTKYEYLQKVEAAYDCIHTHFRPLLTEERDIKNIPLPLTRSAAKKRLEDSARKRMEQRMADQKEANAQAVNLEFED